MHKLILLALLGASFNAQAIGDMADITIIDRIQNRTLPIYKHHGRYYVAGKPGNTYQIHVQNQQSDSIEAVISVDAVNVITGKTAKASQSGYVFDAYRGYDIAGWRKSEDEIAGFYFTEVENSYASRTGRSGNVGVIGVAVFNKKSEIYNAPPQATISRGDHNDMEKSAPAEAEASATQGILRRESPACTNPTLDNPADKAIVAMPESKKLGTGHGAIESSSVTQVAFERASIRPAEVIMIYYDSYKNLVAQGVVPKQKTNKPLAQPFLNENDNGFVPDPS